MTQLTSNRVVVMPVRSANHPRNVQGRTPQVIEIRAASAKLGPSFVKQVPAYSGYSTGPYAA